MFINKRVERAWNVLVFLARYEEANKGLKTCREVLDSTGIGRTDDIWRALIKGNLIMSIRGHGGGFALSKPPGSIAPSNSPGPTTFLSTNSATAIGSARI